LALVNNEETTMSDRVLHAITYAVSAAAITAFAVLLAIEVTPVEVKNIGRTYIL
jgi:hypothetical protein